MKSFYSLCTALVMVFSAMAQINILPALTSPIRNLTGNNPTVTSIVRLSPTTASTTQKTVVYRVTFNEKVTGVDYTDFVVTTVSGNATGILASNAVRSVSGAGKQYDVTVSSITGAGGIRLDVKSSGTNILNTKNILLITGYLLGEVYTIVEPAPSLTVVSVASNNTVTSLAKPGNVVAVSFTSSTAINTPVVTIATKAATVTTLSSTSYRASYIMQSTDAAGVVPFTINFTSTNGVNGTQVSNTTNGSRVTFDKTAPVVSSILRQLPTTATTSAATVVYRVTFSEKIQGLQYTAFTLTRLSGNVAGTIAANAVTAVGTTGSVYDVSVTNITGDGDIRLDLKSTGTGIADAAGNAIATGYTSGEVYTLAHSVTVLNAVTISSSNASAGKAKTGDVVTLSFTASEALNSTVVTIANKPVTASVVTGNSYTASYTFTGTETETVVPFTIDFTNSSNVAGATVTATTDGSSVVFDKTAPVVSTIIRQVPATTTTSASSLTYRVSFSEAVNGVSTTAFALTTVSGNVAGTIAANAIAAVGTGGNVYDVTVTNVTGDGVLRLDVKASGTGITDASGNALAVGFTAGQTYTLAHALPTLTSVTIASSNAVIGKAKTGDVVTLNFTASEPINTPAVTIAGKNVTATLVSGNSYKATYNLLATDAEGVVPFTINFSTAGGTAGATVTATTNGSSVTFDKTAPIVSSINRQLPNTTTTSASSVTYRVSFSEAVSGVNTAAFVLTTVSGNVAGTIAANAIAVVGTGGNVYDVTVTNVTGDGVLRLDVKASGTGITDASGNALAVGFTAGQTYTLAHALPTLTSVTIASSNAVISKAKTGDIVTLNFTASEPINTPAVTIAGKNVTATLVSGNSYKATYTLLATDAEGVVPFTVNFSTVGGTAGATVTATTDGSSVTFDKTAPVVSSITRANAALESTRAKDVVYRVVFAEKVSGVTADDFTVTSTGNASGLLLNTAVTVVGTIGDTYDVTVSSISGDGTLRLDLKAGTDIRDEAGNLIAGGFIAGQFYTNVPGFYSVTPVGPIDLSQPTKDKPQAKVWNYNGYWWCVLSATLGTKVYRLDNTTWTEVLTLNTKNSKPDCRAVGDLVHILMYKGASNNSILYSIKYDVATNKYVLWNLRPTGVNIIFPVGSETATMAIDNNGRMWLASDGVTDMTVYWADAPYTSFSAPVTVATGAKDDDICALVALPMQNKIGLFWSNQNTKLFGFRTHTDGTDPLVWSADETPAAASALNVGVGFADDHMNLKVASDGTVFCAAKTSYNTTGYAKLIMLVRRPNGLWDNVYNVTGNPEGTQPIVVLNEAKRKLKFIYATVENGGDIVYRESSMDNIVFSAPITLIKSTGDLYDYTTSTHQNYTSKIVIIATKVNTTPQQAVTIIGNDDEDLASRSLITQAKRDLPSGILASEQVSSMQAYPNPVNQTATIKFPLTPGAPYELALYNSSGNKQQVLAKAVAGNETAKTISLNASSLTPGMYLLRLQTATKVETIKIMVNR